MTAASAVDYKAVVHFAIHLFTAIVRINWPMTHAAVIKALAFHSIAN